MLATLARRPRPRGSLTRIAFVLLAVTAACGSGSSSAPPSPSSRYAARCAVPRTGIDPQTGAPYADRAGTLSDEKSWVRAWIDDLYLWYREVPPSDAASYATPVAYFDVLKTSALTASGNPKDRFHFTYLTSDWVAFSQSGVEAGYGVQWALLSRTPPRAVVAAYVEAGSPAAAANIVRGTGVVTVDGVDVANGSDVATLNAGLFPAAAGETHTLTLSASVGVTRTVSMTSAAITGTPVPAPKILVTPTGPVGYILFNDHVATAESQLLAAIQQLKAAAVTDLVLDIRYNGGGYLVIASEAAYMIAGPALTAGKIFEKLTFNDKAGNLDPVTGDPNLPYGFQTSAVGLSSPPGTALPFLGLPRVFVLTGPGTCSASESVINSLRGIGVQVILVGSTTCGKPYGFYPADNCGTTYFAIQFQGVNQLGFGDYGDGFVPGGTGASGAPGCSVADDFGHALGDPAESRLASALAYRATGTCPPAPAGVALQARRGLPADGELVRPPWRENRILVSPRP